MKLSDEQIASVKTHNRELAQDLARCASNGEIYAVDTLIKDLRFNAELMLRHKAVLRAEVKGQVKL